MSYACVYINLYLSFSVVCAWACIGGKSVSERVKAKGMGPVG